MALIEGSLGRARGAAIGAAATLAVVLSGCVGRGGPVPYEVQEFGPPDTTAIAVPEAQQRISPLDRLRVTVFQESDLTGEFNVDASGQVDLPLIGPVPVRGMLPSEAAAEIARRLGQRYIRSPNVQVTFVQQAEQTITVDGSVRQPGVIPIRGTTSLIRAVALARGTTEDANPSRVVVFRSIQGQRMAAAFDLQAIRRGQAEDPTIYGNDIVVVDGSRGRALFRDIVSAIPILGIFRPF